MANSEAGVGLVKRASVIVCRAAEHLRYQEQSVALEVGKVDLFEVGSKLRVAENPLIKSFTTALTAGPGQRRRSR
jgi:hypothetical protein